MQMTPSLQSLPEPGASFREIVQFANAYDPTVAFHALWGSEYSVRAMDLWARQRDAFKNGTVCPNESVDELLLCLL